MSYRVMILGGDGCGPEVTNQSIKVIRSLNHKSGYDIKMTEELIGAVSMKRHGVALTDSVLHQCLESDAVLLGAVGDPKQDKLPYEQRPEAALLKLRKEMGVYANLRPVKIFPQLAERCPLKPTTYNYDVDLIFVRELTGGIYFGKRGRTENGAFDTEEYTAEEINRLLDRAIEIARSRKHRLTLVDKSNVLETSRLWRELTKAREADNKDIRFEYIYVDNAAMQLLINPRQFDTIVTTNLFGDILSDEASVLAGSIGMLPSASLGDGTLGLYEPVHGSAPDIAGKNVANPIASILSLAMLLKYSLGLKEAAEEVEKAVFDVLSDNWRTSDIYCGSGWRVEGAVIGSEIANRIK